MSWRFGLYYSILLQGKLEAQKSALTEHHKSTCHDIAWDNARILCTFENWWKKSEQFLKAWQINKTNNAINYDNGLKLPRKYLSVVLQDKRNLNVN